MARSYKNGRTTSVCLCISLYCQGTVKQIQDYQAKTQTMTTAWHCPHSLKGTRSRKQKQYGKQLWRRRDLQRADSPEVQCEQYLQMLYVPQGTRQINKCNLWLVSHLFCPCARLNWVQQIPQKPFFLSHQCVCNVQTLINVKVTMEVKKIMSNGKRHQKKDFFCFMFYRM